MNKKLLYCILVIILWFKTVEAQNLVPNPSFEEHTACQMPIESVKDWYAPDASNPDYFNACAPYDTWMSVPLNTRGYQFARTGDAYIFFGTGISEAINYREHLAVQLKLPLIANKNYCAKFYVVLSETGYYAMDDIGAYLSVGSIDTAGMGTYIIYYKPQVSNPRGNIIMDTLNWVMVGGCFIAQGGEDHITIGSFMPVDSIAYRVAYGDPINWAGYFVDDVSVYECDNPDMPANAGSNKTICPGDSVQLGTTNYDYYKYKWHPSTGLSNDSSGTPIAKPLLTTTYYLQQTNFFDTITTSSVTITVRNCDTLSHENILHIYPNPNSGELYVEFSRYVPADATVSLTNTLGQVLLKEAIATEEKKKLVNTSVLAAGVYFCKIYAGDNLLKTEKIIKIP